MDEADATRWVRAFLATTFAGCAVLALVNFVVNPYGFYPTRFFPALTWSSRLVKTDLLRAAPRTELLVLGSSRAMNLAPRQLSELSGMPAFNAAVDSARAEDWYAMYAFARRDLSLPLREVVLGIDLEAFHDHVDPDSRLLAAKELRTFLPLPMKLKMAAEAVKGLLGYVSTLDSLRSLRMARSGYPPPPYELAPDGMISYRVEPVFNPSTDREIEAYEGRFARYSQIDVARERIFEKLLTETSADGVRVRAFITALHPMLIARLRQTRDFDRLHALVVEYLRDAEARFPNFTVVDFTDVAAFGGASAQFRDGAHINDENARRLAAALWGVRAVQ